MLGFFYNFDLMNKIGIAITVHNRHETAKVTIANIRKFSPKEAKIVIVDDASEIPYEDADCRFKSNAGIAVAKNKCIELLYDKGCTHFFLFDDDVYPLVEDWHLKYINSGLNHACYTFGRKVLSNNDTYIEYEKPNGCMIFLTKKCIDIVGGFDTDFIIWGYEHVNLSDRIFNNGLTPKRYIDVIGSDKLFYSLDEHRKIKSSVSSNDRIKGITNNVRLYTDRFNSTDFKPYK